MITKLQKMYNYVEYLGTKPFSYKMVSETTGISNDVVRVYMSKLRSEGIVKEVFQQGKVKYFKKVAQKSNKGSPDKKRILKILQEHFEQNTQEKLEPIIYTTTKQMSQIILF